MTRLPRLGRLRSAVPPAWRGFGSDPWALAAIAAVILGGSWLLSPTGAVSKLREQRERLTPNAPTNATGQAMGLQRVPRGSGGDPYPLATDPLDVLGRGAGVPSHMSPRYVSRVETEYLRSPRQFLMPLRGQDLRNLAAQPPVLPPPPRGNPSITAADVLAAQLGALEQRTGARS
jgi:hypothetical protein